MPSYSKLKSHTIQLFKQNFLSHLKLAIISEFSKILTNYFPPNYVSLILLKDKVQLLFFSKISVILCPKIFQIHTPNAENSYFVTLYKALLVIFF